MTKAEQIKTLLCQFLDQAQKTFAVHKRCMKSFKKLYHVDHDIFKEELIKQINRLLVIFKREPAVERLVQFIVSACVYTNDTKEKEDKMEEEQEDNSGAEDETSNSRKKKGKKTSKTKEVVKQTKKSKVDDEPLATSLLKYLLQLTNVKDKAVRFRSTQIIAGLISNLEEIDNSLWDDIEERMMDRVHDKYPSVRCQAVIALSRLQDPRNPKDVVVAEYVHLLKVDSSKDVRKAVLSSIGLTKLTVTDVLNRTRDTNEEVRKHAFTIFATKVPVEKLSIDHRVTLLRDGLNDRVEMVRKAAVDMIGFWLKRVKNDPIQLLAFLDVEQNEEVAEKSVKEILKMVENPESFLDWNSLDNEKALYARVYCTDMKTKKVGPWEMYINFQNDERLEEILPEISKFCQILPQYLNNEFVAKQLFLVAKLFDFADEVGRRNLNALVCKLLCSRDISSDLRKVILKLLRRMNPDEDEFIRYVLEILSEIQDPLETSVKWERESTQKDMWLSCLAITEDLLQNTRKTLADPGLAGLLQSVILPAIQHPSPDVRNAAVRCLGLFCLLSKEEARTHLLLFVQIVKNDRDLIKLSTMKVLFDLLLVFGNSLLEGQDMDNVLSQEPSQILSQSTENIEASKAQSPVYGVLNSFLNSTNEDLLTTAVEGLAKLFVTDVFDSPKIISKLLLLFFDPATEEKVRLRQCLSVFFPLYTSQSEKHKDTLKAGLMTAVRTILFASKRTTSSINLTNVAQFVLFLLNSKDHKGGPYHDSLCIEFVDEIVSSEEVKCLGIFELTKSTPQETIKLLRANSDWMLKEFNSDKACSKIIEKFDNTLKGLDQTPNEPIDPQLIKKVEENTFKYRQEQLLLQKENKNHDYDPQTEKQIQKQIDYFNEVDDFKLPGLIPDKKKRKAGTPASWEQEREKIMKEKAQLAKELNKLRRLLEVKQKTGEAADISDTEDKSDAERIPEEDKSDKSDAEEIPLQTKKQKVAPPTINLTKPKETKPPAKPPAAKQEVKSPAPILKRKSEAPQVEDIKRTKTAPPAKTVPSKPEIPAEVPTKAKQQPITVDLSNNNNNNNEPNANAAKPDKTEKIAEKATDKATEKTTEKATDKTADKTTDKSGAPLSKRRRMSSKKSSTEDEEQQPIPEITGLVPSTPIIGTKKTAPQAGKLPESKVKKVVVSFSGFKPDDKIMKDDIIDRVLLLGGEVRLGEVFDSKITHVVSPPNSRTMKTLAASLTSRWIVSPQWILDSTAAGYFVDETNYGRRKTGSALEGKKFYISENFKKENHDKNFKEANYKALIVQLGRGIIVSDMNAADYSLVATGETKTHGVALTWNAFFDLIQNQRDEVDTGIPMT